MNKKLIMTWLFLLIQIIVFLLMELQGGSQYTPVLIQYGAKFAPAIALGEWWRLITPIFLHIGFTHLLVNSVTLYFLGSMVEQTLGHFKFTWLYLAGGIMGNALSYQFSESISAGASTSLFGLFAVFIALAVLYPDNHYISALGRQYRTLIIVNIVMSLFGHSVDLWGHLGGILGGFIATFMIMSGQERGNSLINRVLALVVYIGIVGFILFNHGIYNTLL